MTSLLHVTHLLLFVITIFVLCHEGVIENSSADVTLVAYPIHFEITGNRY